MPAAISARRRWWRQAVPEPEGRFGDGPSRVYQVRESLSGNLTEYPARIGRKPAREFSSVLRFLLPARFQIVGTVKHPTDHIPLGEAHRVIPNGVQHAAVGLPVRLGPGRTG